MSQHIAVYTGSQSFSGNDEAVRFCCRESPCGFVRGLFRESHVTSQQGRKGMYTSLLTVQYVASAAIPLSRASLKCVQRFSSELLTYALGHCVNEKEREGEG